MIRQALMSIATLGTLATAAMPASAQPVWGSVSTGFRIGHTPIQLSVGTAPVYQSPVYVQPAGQAYYDGQTTYVIPANYPTGQYYGGYGYQARRPFRHYDARHDTRHWHR